MPVYTDQMNRVVDLPLAPSRIITLVPSQTELLFDLGLDKEIIGVTKFCIHPEDKVKQKVKVGGTKQVDISVVKKLKPDLIIGNKEENERDQAEELMEHFPVWMSDINDLDSALEMIRKVGHITGKADKACTLAKNIEQQFSNLTIQPFGKTAAYFIWRKPYMIAGKGTFINEMVKRCGLVNAFDIERYPEVISEQLIAAKPDVILLSSEPYPFKEKHIAEFKALCPNATVKVVDGEMFSWYGSRLLKAPAYFQSLELNR
ncbi:MAG: ABC transporter substrate-binding protein [Bacteroidetes bacterium]|nr:ABC transporter substrate-binding protein [Bacteroidota bacterium]